MNTELTSPVSYFLSSNDADSRVCVNDWLGKCLHFECTGQIFCIHCHRKTSKSFNQGYCFPCFRQLAACDTCIMKPEKCHYHLGSCREPLWGEMHCMQPHVIYLSYTSDVKVGITRKNQVPTRWIDQGASHALPIAEVSTRYQSGIIEQLLTQLVKDKTNWRGLLKPPVATKTAVEALLFNRQRCITLIESSIELWQGAQFPKNSLTLLRDEAVVPINYPVLEWPSMIKSINLEKTPSWHATLHGIRGQYWLTDIGVINLRKYTGYEVRIGEIISH